MSGFATLDCGGPTPLWICPACAALHGAAATHPSGVAVACAVVLLLLPGCQWASSGTASRKPGDTERLVELARSAESQRRWSDAVQLLSRAAGNSPGNSQLHRRLADAHLQSGNLAAARSEMKNAVDASTPDADEQAQLAELALRIGDQQLARRLARRALELDSSQIDALLVQAGIAEAAVDPTAAMAVYHRILQIEPNHWLAKLRLATHQIDRGRPHQAAALLRSVCNCPQMPPDKVAEARWKLGQAYAQAERWKDAARELRVALADHKHTTSDDWYQLAWALHRDRRNDESAGVLQSLLKRNPYHQPSKSLLAALNAAPGNPSDGIRYASTERPIP